MAKFVIAGTCDCPYFAKLELLACQLSTNLPHFQVHKIVLPAAEWDDWLQEICTKNNWSHSRSPIVWRELVERGGKGKLLGGFNEFMEYAQCYYGVTSDMMTPLMLSIRDENVITNAKKIENEMYYKSLSNPIHVCIANASHPAAYHLLPRLASGDVFGADVELSIHLYDTEEVNLLDLEGVVMEMEDLAFPLLHHISVSSDPRRAFADVSFLILLEDPSQQMQRAQERKEPHDDVILNHAARMRGLAEVLDDVALPDTKVVIAGCGPINFNAQALMHYTKKIKTENIIASSRLQERRARAILSRKLQVNSNNVKDVIIWGSCSNDATEDAFLIDTSSARVHGYDGAVWGPDWFSRSLVEMIHDNKWMSSGLLSSHHNHDHDLKKAMKHATSMSEAAALASLLRDWVQGSSPDEITSLGVKSEGSYDMSDCVVSLPVRFTMGCYHVVDDLTIDEETCGQMKKMERELKKDLGIAFPDVYPPEKQVFGDQTALISSSQTDLPVKTLSGLDVITEEEPPPEAAPELAEEKLE